MNSVFCADIGTSSLKAALVDFSGRVLAFSRVQFGLFYTDHAAGEWLGALRKALAGCISFVGGGADICATANIRASAGVSANTAGTGGADIRATAGTGVSFANTGASGQGTQISIDAICISGNGPTLCGVDGKTLLWNADLGLGVGVAGTGCSSGTGTSGNTADVCAAAGTGVSSANPGASDTAGTFGTAASSANTGISGNTAVICATASTGCSSGTSGAFADTAGTGSANICATANTDVSFANTGASGTAGTFGTAASSANTGISAANTASTAVPSANTKSLYIPRILGFAKKFPSYWQQKDCTVFSGPEYLIYLLTGASVSILPEKRFLEAYWSREAFKEAGLSAEDAEDAMQKLPSFVPPASIAGSLTKTAAEFLCGGEGECAVGLVKDGIPVVCGAPDFISALVGTNTLRAGLFCDRAGSSEGINLCTSKPVAGQGIRTLPSIIPGLWNASVLLPESGERFCAYKEKISRLYARPISLDEMVQILLESDGSLAELDQGKYLMLQTAMMVRDGLNALRRAAEESGAVPALKTEMTVTGGQAENALWNQMKANVTGYTLYTQSLVHAELTGDAVFALLALGLYKDIHSAAAVVCKREVCYEPQEVS